MNPSFAMIFQLFTDPPFHFAGRCDKCHRLSERLLYFHEVRDEFGIPERKFLCDGCQEKLRYQIGIRIPKKTTGAFFHAEAV